MTKRPTIVYNTQNRKLFQRLNITKHTKIRNFIQSRGYFKKIVLFRSIFEKLWNKEQCNMIVNKTPNDIQKWNKHFKNPCVRSAFLDLPTLKALKIEYLVIRSWQPTITIWLSTMNILVSYNRYQHDKYKTIQTFAPNVLVGLFYMYIQNRITVAYLQNDCLVLVLFKPWLTLILSTFKQYS